MLSILLRSELNLKNWLLGQSTDVGQVTPHAPDTRGLFSSDFLFLIFDQFEACVVIKLYSVFFTVILYQRSA